MRWQLWSVTRHTSSVRVELPFSLLTFPLCTTRKKSENLFLSSQLQTSTGIRILTCEALSPLQIQKLLFHPICLLVLFFICFSVSSLFISLLFCVSIFCSLERKIEGKDLFSCCSCCSIYEMWTLMAGWSTFCCICTFHGSFLPLSQTSNQTLAPFSCSNLPWAKTHWLHICSNLLHCNIGLQSNQVTVTSTSMNCNVTVWHVHEVFCFCCFLTKTLFPPKNTLKKLHNIYKQLWFCIIKFIFTA